MFKHVSILLCLLGVSLASKGLKRLENPAVADLLEAVKKHQGSFEECQDTLGEDVKILKTCAAAVEDMETLASDVSSGVSEAMTLYEDGVELFAKFTKCSTESILKQIACYEKVVTSAKSLVSTAEEEVEEFQEELTADVTQLEEDIEECVESGYTSQMLYSKMALCKLRLMLKN